MKFALTKKCCLNIHISNIERYTCVCVYVCINIERYAGVCVCVCINIERYTCLYMCVYIHIERYMLLCVCIYIWTHTVLIHLKLFFDGLFFSFILITKPIKLWQVSGDLLQDLMYFNPIFRIPSKVSIGFASGLFTGQSRSGILFSLNKFFVDFAVWGGVRSC